ARGLSAQGYLVLADGAVGRPLIAGAETGGAQTGGAESVAVEGAGGAGAVRVAVPAGADPAALAEAIASGGLARGVEPDALVRAAIIPNDSAYERQSAYLDAIHAPAAWDRVTGDGTTVIAIVDSGLDYDHPEFVGRIAINPNELFGNGRDDDRNGCIDDIAGCNFVTPQSADPSCLYRYPTPNWRAWDDAGHGTVVAGIAAAAGDDGQGVTGVAWNARVLPVKVLDCTGVGRISTASAGIRYAADRGAHVINISLGTPNDSLVLRAAVEYAQRSGALIVASAGNVPGEVTFPGAYPGVIAVGASGAIAGNVVDYTLPTPFTGSGPQVDLIAPGLLIAGPLPGALCDNGGWQCEGGPYTRASGSSFAAALVAGAAALLREEHPTFSGPLLSSLLLRSLQPSPAGGPGVLDLAAALDAPLFGTGVPGTARSGSAAPVAPHEEFDPTTE
ncbi:MAG: S8 family serine peptidase, partial [Chloroflexi bacterium]|nr:S8 family serine peptidase [Chloroflexota bacterium]